MTRARFEYEWKDGFSHHEMEAVVVYDELLEVANKSGEKYPRPELVVKAASRKGSLLHEFFEWDDTRAAHAHRLYQARGLFRSIEVIEIETEIRSPAFVNVLVNVDTGEKKRAYVPFSKVQSTPSYRDCAEEEAWKGLLAWQNRFQQVAGFERVHQAIAVLIKKLKKDQGDI